MSGSAPAFSRSGWKLIFAAPDCNGATNGGITINNIQSGTPPYLYSWDNGPFTSDNTLDNLGVGTYHLVIRDANNCETEFDIPLEERVLTADAQVDKPLCFGDDNGVITMNVTNGEYRPLGMCRCRHPVANVNVIKHQSLSWTKAPSDFAPRATIVRLPLGRGRCSSSAFSGEAVIQISISSLVRRITGIALG